MKPELRAGFTHTQRITVDRDRTMGFMGEAMRVYSTPARQAHCVGPEDAHALRPSKSGHDLPGGHDADHPLASLHAASCTYRIALGPRAGQKVLFGVTVAPLAACVYHGRIATMAA